MPSPKEELERLKSSQEYKSYKEESPDSYLTSVFILATPNKVEDADIEIGFYSPESGQVQGFLMSEHIVRKKQDKPFQKEKSHVSELNLEEVKTTAERALSTVEKLRQSRYPGEVPSKLIIILQVIDEKTVWNITVMTETLKILNVKLDASTLDVISEKMESMMSFRV